MKGTIAQAVLNAGLAAVFPAVAGKSTLPVLSNVLMVGTDDGVVLKATNLEIGIMVRLIARVEVPGAITVPAKLLKDVVGSYPDAPIGLSLAERTQTLHLGSGLTYESSIKGISADEFPVFPEVRDGLRLTAPAAQLRAALGWTTYAAAADDTRPVLAGVLVEARGRQIVFAAADGFRLAKTVITLPDSYDEAPTFSAIVPARALSEAHQLMTLAAKDGDDVTIAISQSGGQLLIEMGNITLITRLIEGRYPEIDRIIPAGFQTRAIASVTDLKRAVKLASFVASTSSNIVRLVFEDAGEVGTITITANAAEVGDQKAVIDAQVAGAGGQIAVNVKFLSEGVGLLDVAQVALEIQTPQAPLVFSPVGVEGVTHVLMPMTVR